MTKVDPRAMTWWSTQDGYQEKPVPSAWGNYDRGETGLLDSGYIAIELTANTRQPSPVSIELLEHDDGHAVVCINHVVPVPERADVTLRRGVVLVFLERRDRAAFVFGQLPPLLGALSQAQAGDVQRRMLRSMTAFVRYGQGRNTVDADGDIAT